MNDSYNSMLSDLADLESDEESVVHDKWHSGKRIPYIGAFWRHVNLKKPIPIGKCINRGMVGIMINNKWHYPERTLSESEQMKLLQIIEKSHSFWINGKMEECKKHLEAIWILAQEWDTLNDVDDLPCDFPEERAIWFQPWI